MTAMQDVSATETAIIYGLEPLWGAAFAWFMLQERWGATGWFGAILILGKIYFQRTMVPNVKKIENIHDVGMVLLIIIVFLLNLGYSSQNLYFYKGKSLCFLRLFLYAIAVILNQTAVI